MTSRSRAEAAAAALSLLTFVTLAAVPARPARAAAARASFGALYATQRFTEAESLARVRLADAERRTGPASLETATWLDSLVMALYELDRHAEPATRELGRRAIEIRERKLGATAPAVVPPLVMLANLHLASSEPAIAESLLLRAADVQRRALPTGDPARAEVLDLLGRARDRLGRYDDADSSFAEASRLLARAGPEFDEERSSNSFYRGSMYTSVGRYEESRRAFEESMAITERLHGPEHPDIVAAMNGVATALQRLGRYDEARPLFERIVRIDAAAMGPGSLRVASARNNLGVLLLDMRLDREALVELRAAAEVFERELGANSMSLARALTTMGAALGDLDSAAAAIAPLERALAIKLSNLGPGHPSTVLTMSSLAVMYGRVGRTDEALALHRRVLDARLERLGPDHPDVADTWRYLGSLYLRMGHADSAVAACDSATAILRRRFEPQHPARVRIATDLAVALAANGERDSALAAALGAEDAWRDHVRLTMRALSEDEALRYVQAGQPPLPVVLTLAARGLEPAGLARAHDALVRSRTLLLDALAERRRGSAAPDSGATLAARERWRAAQQRLARWLVASGGTAAARESLAAARAAALAADRALAAASPAHRATRTRDVAGLADVVRALPPGAALVSYVRARFDRRLEPGADRYLAFVAIHGRPERCAVLGPASGIDSLAAAWRALAGRAPSTATAGADQRACDTAGAALRAAIWDPLAESLAGTGHVFVVPDGQLALVAFHALPAARGGYLVERGQVLHLLGSELDALPADAAPAGTGLVAFGDPDFDGAATATPLVAAAFRGERPPCDEFRSWRWGRLPGSGEEARAVAAVWNASEPAHPADVRLGAEATEAELRALAPGARIVHVATHGFFLDRRCHGAAPGERGVGGVVRERAAEPDSGASAPEGATLRLAGLVLAGANRREAASDAADDGILTAEEVATLDLGAARWVVLSACETGVGDVESSAGVTGLRRAFRAAGAGTLVISLWGVSDRATLEWMRALYDAHFARGLGAAESLRDACRAVLARRRHAKESTHPFYWGGFVATGSSD